jgi:enoyl-CoA hydratase/carnithine racemase
MPDTRETRAAGRIVIARDGPVATVTLANPARRNAISVPMWEALAAFARATHDEPGIRVVIIRGEGRQAFSAGADISGFAEARSGTANARAYDDLVEEACLAIEGMRCPSIALIHGPCVGAGSSVAASCDLRMASNGSFIAVPAARLGLGYDPRGIKRFLRVFGQAATSEILFTADRFPVERAAALGVVAEVAGADEIEARTLERARRIASNAPITVAAAKAAVRAHVLGESAQLDVAMRLYEEADASEDYREGRAAFLAKRDPQFKGR